METDEARELQQVLDLSRECVTGVTEVAFCKGMIFPGAKGKPLSDMSLSRMMRLAGQEATVHGFRSSFRSRHRRISRRKF